MMMLKAVNYVVYLAFLMVIGIYVISPSEVSYANNKTMDDAGPTNPVNTGRFPKMYTAPAVSPTPQGAVFANPTASPASN